MGPSSGSPRLWKEGALLDSLTEGWTKRVQGGPRGLETKTQGRALVGQAVCQDRVGRGLCATRSHVFKNISAVSSGETI